MHPGNKIFLIGFMGSGKSTVGRKLASYLRWTFIDLDERIEQKTGMKISDIFKEKGESWFRKMESELLKSLLTEAETVISTGGGVPCSGNNMNYMHESGLTIYLKMTPGQLKSRLLRSSKERPLLKDISKDELESYIEKKLREREKWYSGADITFNRFDADLSDLFLLVKKWIKV